ncbi:MAG: methyltransferase domain-containing protein [Deltaproteobacteria bacterium]|nr:methyltransferase domain-containing protein [Deltaproteobacteria bacterium]
MLTIRFDRLGLSPGSRVLDVGCGGGRHTCEAYSLPGVLSVGADLSHKNAAATRGLLAGMEQEGRGHGSWQVLCADAASLPFSDASFDAVVCSEVLEHVDHPPTVCAELARVLRPGGVLAISVPRYLPEKICWMLSDAYRTDPGGHVRIFRKRELIDLVEAAGVRYTGRHYAHALHVPYWWLKCLVGVKNDAHPLPAAWHRLLVWDIMKKPLATRAAETLLNPVMGKSLVCYFQKPA